MGIAKNNSQQHHPGSNTLLVLMGMALLGSAWVIDPWAEAGFEAPKRFLVVAIGLVCALLWLQQPIPWRWHTCTRDGKRIAMVGMLALGFVVISCLIAPQFGDSFPILRTWFGHIMFLLVAALPVFNFKQRAWLVKFVMVAVLSTACISILQLLGFSIPLTLRWSGRLNSGALLGNEGYVALACALMGCAALPVLILSPIKFAHQKRTTAIAASILLFAIACIIFNQQRTSILVLSLCLIALLMLRWRLVLVLKTVIALLFTLVFVFAVPAFSQSWWGRLTQSQLNHIQHISSYRLGAWVATTYMIQDHAWLGHGLGSFADQSTMRRLQAEKNLQRRFHLPPKANAHSEAHQEYWQLAAEAGLPALGLSLLALWMLLVNLAQRWFDQMCMESAVLFSVLLSGALLGLTWFPMQIPLTALILLLAAGRGWRLVASPTETAS